MTKRYVRCLHRAVEGIIKDALDTYPTDHRELIRDLSRISSLVESRGLPVFTLDFPALLKHFDKCLSDGAYVPSSLPCSKRWRKGSVIPRLFKGILIRIFDDCGVLRSEPDINAIALIRQLYAIGKKVSLDCKKEKVYETISDFYQVEVSLPYPDANWDGETLDVSSSRDYTCRNYRLPPRGYGDSTDSPVSTGQLDICQKVFDILSTTLGDFNPLEWRPKHGPGAVADLKAREYKYHFPAWSSRLETVFPYADLAFANHGMWADSLSDEIEDCGNTPSRLITVPKTQKGPRLIAAEPVAHQWCQQIIWNYMDERVSNSWIGKFVRFRDQTFNQEGARLASSSQDSWTVDLSAASDRVTTRLVERLFRANQPLLNALHASRTRIVHQEIDKNTPSMIELRKFSTMGSACTFPVETVAFLSIAIAACLYRQDKKATLKNILALTGRIRIFGDDCIIPSYAGEDFENLLCYFDFKVNQSKTHRNGKFRESCGLEAYDGVDVTPAYLLKVPEARKPESIASVVASSNNFYLKGWWNAAEAIKSTVTIANIATVGVGSGCFGWQSYSANAPRGKTRWNDKLHRTEYRALTLRVKAARTRIHSSAALLQYFTERPSPDTDWESGVVQRPSLKLRLGWEPADLAYETRT